MLGAVLAEPDSAEQKEFAGMMKGLVGRDGVGRILTPVSLL